VNLVVGLRVGVVGEMMTAQVRLISVGKSVEMFWMGFDMVYQ
jgi:hypothetical protein